METSRAEGHAGAITSLVFSPDGRYVVSTSMDRTAILWRAGGPEDTRADGT
jgi:WD40 repeat protein